MRRVPMDRRTGSRRGLIAVILILVLLALTVEILRPDSIIRGAFRDATSPASTPLERVLDRVRP